MSLGAVDATPVGLATGSNNHCLDGTLTTTPNRRQVRSEGLGRHDVRIAGCRAMSCARHENRAMFVQNASCGVRHAASRLALFPARGPPGRLHGFTAPREPHADGSYIHRSDRHRAAASAIRRRAVLHDHQRD